MRTLTLCWLALLALAVTGVLLGGAGDSPWLLAAVLACAVAKGWLIGERFMEAGPCPGAMAPPAAGLAAADGPGGGRCAVPGADE